MEIPAEFKQFSYLLMPDLYDKGTDIFDWFPNALKDRSGERKRIVKNFLDELLDGTHDNAELQRVWRSTAPRYGFNDEGLRYFLTLVRDSIK
jgi:hypothetical protein